MVKVGQLRDNSWQSHKSHLHGLTKLIDVSEKTAKQQRQFTDDNMVCRQLDYFSSSICTVFTNISVTDKLPTKNSVSARFMSTE